MLTSIGALVTMVKLYRSFSKLSPAIVFPSRLLS